MLSKKTLAPLAVVFLAAILFFSYKQSYVKSATDYVVISEIQIGGATANDEFVELYNATSTDVDLTGWKLRKKTSSGTESPLISSMSGMIKAHGFFLITHPDVSGNYQYDNIYSSGSYSLSNNNTVILKNSSDTTIDLVGYGDSASDYETQPAINPAVGESIERKAFETSSVESMTVGSDTTRGNSYDSNNNYNDLILRNIPNPQGTISDSENPEVEVSPTPNLSETPTPTQEPTSTLTPTEEPQPSETPTPTPDEITSTPTPTETPQPPITKEYYMPFLGVSCKFNYVSARFGFIIMRVPVFSCAKSQ